MYPIDFLSASPADIINRSITCHLSAFVERLRALARQHGEYARTTSCRDAARIADRLRADINAAADDVELFGECAPIMARGMAAWIPVFQAACDLQLVPRPCRDDIVARA